MNAEVFAIILLGAVLHATWNAVVKGGTDKLLTTCLVTSVAAVIALVLLPFLSLPAKASWPYLLASVLCQVLYYVLVARTYRVADMSQAYPIMRGTAPLLVAASSVVLWPDSLSLVAWLGIAIISTGILSMAATRAARQGKGLAMALGNACVIASYTLIDGLGVRLSSAPVAYTLWIFLLTGIPLAAWALLSQGASFRAYAAGNWRPAIVGGCGTLASYGLALWAMTAAPVATVSALRETSILFAVIIAAVVLKEHLPRTRVAAACLIALGAGVLQLS